MARPKEPIVDNSIGKRVRYIGMGNAKFICHWCKRSFHKGMITEYEGNRYCNDDCIRAEVRFSKV